MVWSVTYKTAVIPTGPVLMSVWVSLESTMPGAPTTITTPQNLLIQTQGGEPTGRKHARHLPCVSMQEIPNQSSYLELLAWAADSDALS